MSRFWPKVIYAFFFFIILVSSVSLPVAEALLFQISVKDEIEMGRTVARQIEKQYGLVPDPAMQDRIAAIGSRIAEASDRKDFPYTFKVLNCQDINAFALPGGFIYINKGLIDYLSSDEELAGVIGHEVGHVSKRHIVHQLEKAQDYTIGALLLFGDRGLMLQNVVISVIMAGYSRADEREADHLGLIHTMRAEYNPYSMLIGLQRLNDKDSRANFDLFSDHPETSERIKLMQKYLVENQIHPQVVQTEKSAIIVDKDLNLPPLYATYRGYKPLYRAELAAGALYQLTKIPDISGDWFTTDDNGIFTTIYYGDREIIVLTPQDASANNTTLAGLTEQYIVALKVWADKNAAP